MSTFPDRLYQMGGVPVGGGDRFAGWWTNSYFVDFDNGSDGYDGKSTRTPFNNLYKAITTASAGDVIYIRPRTTVGTQGTNQVPITPAAAQAANWTIPRTKNHLSIIGTREHCGIQNGIILQGYAGVNTPTITVLSPYCTFENIGFQQAAAQLVGGIRVNAGYPGTKDGFGCVIDNCNFHVHAATGHGAVIFDSGRYNQCLNSQFWHCVVGVNLGASAMAIQGAIVRNCDFNGADTDVDTDIQIATAQHILIDNNRFNHAQPNYTTGAYKMYVKVVTSATGLLVNNWFGTTDIDIDTACTPGSLIDLGNKCAEVTGAVFMTNAA